MANKPDYPVAVFLIYGDDHKPNIAGLVFREKITVAKSPVFSLQYIRHDCLQDFLSSMPTSGYAIRAVGHDDIELRVPEIEIDFRILAGLITTIGKDIKKIRTATGIPVKRPEKVS